MSEVMLFPLGSVIFPEGKMRLRIFEPRYKRLVAQASQGDNTFGICLFERQSQDTSVLSAIGTQVLVVVWVYDNDIVVILHFPLSELW